MADLIGEHEVIVLTEDLPAEKLSIGPKKDLHAGARGTVVDVCHDPASYTVEFESESERRFPEYHLADLRPHQVRPAEEKRSPTHAAAGAGRTHAA